MEITWNTYVCYQWLLITHSQSFFRFVEKVSLFLFSFRRQIKYMNTSVMPNFHTGRFLSLTCYGLLIDFSCKGDKYWLKGSDVTFQLYKIKKIGYVSFYFFHFSCCRWLYSSIVFLVTLAVWETCLGLYILEPKWSSSKCKPN